MFHLLNKIEKKFQFTKYFQIPWTICKYQVYVILEIKSAREKKTKSIRLKKLKFKNPHIRLSKFGQLKAGQNTWRSYFLSMQKRRKKKLGLSTLPGGMQIRRAKNRNLNRFWRPVERKSSRFFHRKVLHQSWKNLLRIRKLFLNFCS